MTYRRIVLAYDGSLEGRAALREGALLARKLGAQIFLLSVVAESAGMRIGDAAYPDGVGQTRQTYKDLFDEGIAWLRDKGMKPEGRIVEGEPAPTIAAYAKDVGADLVVVGHRKQSLLQRWWSGGAGAYLVDHLNCSLLIGRLQVSDEDFREAFGTAQTAD
jgi:nucleotide-binding universal stress UspA family protein